MGSETFGVVAGGRAKTTLQGTAVDFDGNPVERDIFIFSFSKDTTKTGVDAVTMERIGFVRSDSSGNWFVGVSPVVMSMTADDAYDESNSVIVLAIGETSQGEKSVVYDQIDPIAL